jgi:hypothetical protein
LKEREEKIKQIHEFQNELRNNKKIINWYKILFYKKLS